MFYLNLFQFLILFLKPFQFHSQYLYLIQNYKNNKLLVSIKFYFNYLNIFDYFLQFDIFVITGSSFFFA